ncbi:MAG: hypothetical protein J0I29_07910 [Rhizobiales bacterium]|nr:hypothetical protein [Hyphomicrobiales bacterium]
MGKITHMFVLMLENRSFDHMLSFSGLPGVSEPPPHFHFSPGATDQLADDPNHEFENVKNQIHGGLMDGFSADSGPETMKGFDETEVPVLVQLARDNLYFDNWFSSMPGPTWPNRLFAHCGSSGGLDNSLGSIDAKNAVTNPGYCLNFENGHIFDRLTSKGVDWRIYHHHYGAFNFDYPQALCLKGMVDKRNDRKFFRPFSEFASDVAKGDLAGYTFIEPKYGLPSYRAGNSQHPIGTISLGEILIRDVYRAIFGQSVGDNSALLITWDEHGGFFDHVNPPAATSPGDKPLNQARAKNPQNYSFDHFGIRVPAVLISPWLKAGLGSQVFGNVQFDHSSIVRALRSMFALGGQLTNRDGASPDWNSAILPKPRKLNLKLPTVAQPRLRSTEKSFKQIAASGAPSGNLLGTCQIAIDIDWHTAERLDSPPLIVSEFYDRLAAAHRILGDSQNKVQGAELANAHLTIIEYIDAVSRRDMKVRASFQKSSKGLARKKAATRKRKRKKKTR